MSKTDQDKVTWPIRLLNSKSKVVCVVMYKVVCVVTYKELVGDWTHKWSRRPRSLVGPLAGGLIPLLETEIGHAESLLGIELI